MSLRFAPRALLATVIVGGLGGSAWAAPASAPATPTPVSSTVIRPRSEELRRAFERHDPVELERLARRMGTARLCMLIDRGSPATRAAALGGLTLVDDAIHALPKLTQVADRADTPPELALALLEASRTIVERAARGEAELDELPSDVLRASAESLTQLAAREERPLEARLTAVATLAAMVPLLSAAPARLASLVGTTDPTLRRAVADALPATSTQPLVKLLTDDGSSAVAAAAAAVLCREVPLPGAEKKGSPALRRAVELPAPARQRLRALVADATLDETDRLELIPCLRPGAQKPEALKDDLEVLKAIAAGGSESLKRRARAYGAR